MKTNTTIKNENTAVITNTPNTRFPRMIPLQTLANETGISYKALWQMCRQNRIVYIKSGNKYLVNEDKFREFLNTGEQY